MKQKLPILAALCALFLLIVASDTAIERAAWGLRLCGELLVPSLFPFFVVSGPSADAWAFPALRDSVSGLWPGGCSASRARDSPRCCWA